jgi:hypothetical protein
MQSLFKRWASDTNSTIDRAPLQLWQAVSTIFGTS